MMSEDPVTEKAGCSDEWHPMDGGATLGTIGSENGSIVRDEEHTAGARITMEHGGHTPYGITCGIYGCFVHTAFASNETEANDKYDLMKVSLSELIAKDGSIPDELQAFCDRF